MSLDIARCCCDPPAKREVLFLARDYVSGHEFQVMQCTGCGLAFTVPVPERWEAYYPPSYYGEVGSARFPAAAEWLQEKLYQQRVRRVQKYADGKPGRVLDVGCGRGVLLRAFRQAGWEVAGTEMSESAAAHARGKLGLPVQIGEPDFPDESFDAVILWHVLEHFAQPADRLRHIQRLLRPGGILLVAVPNFGSLEARLARDKWFHLDVPRHLTHFTEACLVRCLEKSGFRTLDKSIRSMEYDCFSAVQSTLNRIGLRHNMLFNLLRRRGAKLTTHGNAAQIIAHAVMLPIACAMGALALVGGGSTIIMHCRKVV